MLSITSVQPAVISSLGGEELRLTGTFPEALYDVYVVVNGVETRCRPMTLGSGGSVRRDNATTLRVTAPALQRAASAYTVRVRQQGGSSADLPNALDVENHSYHSRVYSFRRFLPPVWNTTFRRVEQEPGFPDELVLNNAPAIDAIPDLTFTLGVPFSFTPTHTDADGPGPYEWRVASSSAPLPSWATVNPLTGEVSGTPDADEVSFAGLVLELFDGYASGYSNVFALRRTPGDRLLAGAVVATSTTAASAAVERVLAGSAAAASAVANDLAVDRPLAGSAAAASAVANDLAVDRPLAGSAAAASAVASELEADRTLAGSVVATTASAADLAVDREMIGGGVTTASTASATASAERALAAQATATAAASAAVGVERTLAGALAAVSAVSGALTGDAQALFHASLSSSGVSKLPTNLTANGIEVAPTFRYEAKDISGTTWTAAAGDNLVETGAGAAPTPNRYGPFTDTTRTVKYGGTGAKYHEAASTSFGDVDAEDFAVELVFFVKEGGGNGVVLAKRSGLTTGDGFIFRIQTATPNMYVGYGNGGVNASLTPTFTFGWNHLIAFFDRSGGAAIYVNGALSVSNATATLASMVSTSPLRVGGHSSATSYVFDEDVAFASMWKQASWFDTHLQATVAAERFARLTGFYADTAAGSALPTFTRATSVVVDLDHADDGVRRLHLVGSGWPRIAKRKEASTSTRRAGYLAEGQETNLILRSDEMSDATWVKEHVTVAANAVSTPFQDARADTMTPNTNNATHRVSQSFAATSGQRYIFSCWVKANGYTDFRLHATGTFASSSQADADLALGTVVTGAGANASFIEAYGDGWYRVGLNATATSTGTGSMRLTWGHTAGTQPGDGVSGFHLFGAQLQTTGSTSRRPTSYIPTTSATATRNADRLSYDTAGNVPLSGAALLSLMTSVGGDKYLLRAWKNADPGGENLVFSTNGATAPECLLTAGGVAQAQFLIGGNPLNTGNGRNLVVNYATDDVEFFIDGVSQGTDTTATMPAVLDKLEIGYLAPTSKNPYGLIYDVAFYDQAVAP